MDDQYIKTIIDKHKRQAIDMPEHEVALYLTQKTKSKKSIKQKAIYLTLFMLLGAGIYLIKYTRPITKKPVQTSSALPSLLPAKSTQAPLAANTQNKTKPTAPKPTITKKQNQPQTNPYHINIIDKEDYTTYNNIADINTLTAYNNVNTIITTTN